MEYIKTLETQLANTMGFKDLKSTRQDMPTLDQVLPGYEEEANTILKKLYTAYMD